MARIWVVDRPTDLKYVNGCSLIREGLHDTHGIAIEGLNEILQLIK